jgi:hypothetical protein
LAARVSNAGVSLAVGLLSAFFASARLIKAPAEPLASARPSRVVGMLCGGLSGFYKYDRACGRSAFSNLRSSAAARTRHFRGHQRHILRGGELDEALAIRCAWTDDTREYSYISQLVSPCPGFDMGGVLLVRRFSAERLARALYSMLLLIGMKLIWDGISGLTAGGAG